MTQRKKKYVVTLGLDPGDLLEQTYMFTHYTNDDGAEYWQSAELYQDAMHDCIEMIMETLDGSEIYISPVTNYRDIVVIDLSDAGEDREKAEMALDDLFGRSATNIHFTDPFRIQTSKATFITWKEEK